MPAAGDRGLLQAGVDGPDWDATGLKDRILNLKPDEIGYQKIISLKNEWTSQKFKVLETILEVKLDKPILPRSKVVLIWNLKHRYPCRFAGAEEIIQKEFDTMSQWYPKLCEYDYEGWHPTPYVGREFYGVWGDFDVNISIDKNYILGATGYLQNANQIGYGYETPGTKVIKTGR